MMCLSLVEPHGKHIAAKHQDTSNFSTDTANTRKKKKKIYIYIHTSSETPTTQVVMTTLVLLKIR